MFSTTGFVFHYQFCNQFKLVPILNLVSQKCSFIFHYGFGIFRIYTFRNYLYFHYWFCFRLLTRLYFVLVLVVLFSSTSLDFVYFFRFRLLLWVSSTALGFVYCFCFILRLFAWFICLFLGQ